MNKVFLLLGSNLANPLQQLDKAMKKICEMSTVVSTSSVYLTEAWGKRDQPDFLNQVLLIHTKIGPEEILKEMLAIETSMGRERYEKNSPRIIDIDILFYNSIVLRKDELIIPHPRIAERRFVLTPLNEIASGFVHPELNMTISEMLHACPDPLDVKRY